MTNEKNVALGGRAVSAAAARITELAAEMEYSAVPTAPRTYQLIRTRRRRLRATRVETMVVTLIEDRSGTRARITGDVDELFLQHLGGVEVGSERYEISTPPDGERAHPSSPPPAQHVARTPAPTPRHERNTVRPSANPSGLIAAVPGSAGAPPRLPPPQPTQSTPDNGGGDDVEPNQLGHLDDARSEEVIEHTMMRPARHVAPVELHSPRIVTSDGRTMAIETTIVIGRNPDTDRGGPGATPLAIDDRSISKTHAILGLDGDELIVTDLHSSNGTRMEAAGLTTTCEPGVPVRLPTGDVTLHLGTARFDVRTSR